jgi:aryl-alcohol dehydrogenase-like predicted oxidoreductase
MTWGNQNTEKDAHEQLSYAFDNGINIFDSAEAVRLWWSLTCCGYNERDGVTMLCS